MDILEIGKEVLSLEASELEKHASLLGSEFEKACKIAFETKGKLIVTGVGKSGHIGAKIAATLASTGTPSFFLHPTEAMHGDLGMIESDDCVLAISYSGKSGELLAILPHIKAKGVKIIAMSQNASPLANLSDANIDLDIKREACPFNAAPTVSTTLTLALGDALAMVLMRLKDFKANDFAASHPGGALGKRLFLKVCDVMKTQDLPLISAKASLKEAIAVMTSKKLGSALLTDESGKMVAMLSDGDLRRALENPNFSLNAPALNFANANPKVLENDDLLAYDALKLLESYKIQLLVITKAGIPTGVLHIHDLTALGLK